VVQRRAGKSRSVGPGDFLALAGKNHGTSIKTETAWRDRASRPRAPTAPGESGCGYRAADRFCGAERTLGPDAGGQHRLRGAAAAQVDRLDRRRPRCISPSLGTLDALAKALNVPITRLFAETDERRDCSFVKAGTGVRIERRGTKAGHRYDLLGHSLGGVIAVEPYLITLAEDAAPYTHFRHAGVEFIYMLSGKVRYRHGDRTYLMEPGDALFFDAAARHGPEDLIKVPMHYLSIIIYPREG
jgi:mannose-6-phosphate isomerase-like protein (cupin superfamily)